MILWGFFIFAQVYLILFLLYSALFFFSQYYEGPRGSNIIRVGFSIKVIVAG